MPKLYPISKRSLSTRVCGCNEVVPRRNIKGITIKTKRSFIMVGEKIKVKQGASLWMKKHGYWLDSMGWSIDGMIGTINGDYTNLVGNDSHWSIDFGFDCNVGVHPKFVETF
jgi:hypothetical protein